MPSATLKRFETDAEISLRQFAMLLSALGHLDDLDALTFDLSVRTTGDIGRRLAAVRHDNAALLAL